MLAPWLASLGRDPSPYSMFKVFDAAPTDDCPTETKKHMSKLLQDAAIDPSFVEMLTKRLGWSAVQEFIKGRQPSLSRMKRGRFGEIVTAGILSEQYGYRVPVYKLRFQITNNQSLPGTDVLALRLTDAGAVSEVCYVESKLRAASDHAAVVEGCRQLAADHNSRMPDIVGFVAARLQDSGSELLEPFLGYLADRQNTTEKDSFALGLSWEASKWTEDHLKALAEAKIELPRLTVYATRLHSIRKLTDEVFAMIGIHELDDEDD